MIKFLNYFIIIIICFSCNKDKYVKTYTIPKLQPIIETVELTANDNKKPFSWSENQSFANKQLILAGAEFFFKT